MNRNLRFAGLVLASLTISTVAMAQQDGGGRGGDGGGAGGSGNSGDSSILEVLRQDARKPRLTRAIQPRPGPNCVTHACQQPPETRQPRGSVAQFDADCTYGEVMVLRGRTGRVVHYPCRNL